MQETENYIITTRIRETWPSKKDVKVCFPSIEPLDNYPGKNFIYNSFVINDRILVNDNQLLKDFEFLNDLYEKILDNLTSYLNTLHNVQHKKKFWRIVLGPWLIIYLFMSYDKWKKIRETVEKFFVNKAIVLNFDKSYLTPYELEDFINLTQNDLWNQTINQEICKEFLSDKNIEEVEFHEEARIKKELEINRLKGEEHGLIKKILFKLLSFANKKNYKFFIYKPYIGAIKESILSKRLNQLPIFSIYKKKYYQKKKIDYNLRNNLKALFTPNSKFENYILESLKYHLPKIFIENFEDLDNFSKNSNLPENPSKIFSSNGLWYDSFFAYYAALLNEKGSKIIYAQHGGSYGIAKYSWQEDHEKKISDKYLTWGWNTNNHYKNLKKFNILIKNKKYDWNKKKDKFLVLLKHRKVYLQAPDTFAASESHKDYLEYLYPFLNSLNNNIKKKMILRLTFKDYKTNNFDFYMNFKEQFNFSRKNTLEEACDEAKIVINTCNSTTFLETIGSNIPSILVINKKNNPVRAEAEKRFNILYENNLIFYDSHKATKFINDLWNNDIKKWWQAENIQRAVREFQSHYARTSDNIVDDLFNELHD